MLLAGVFWDQNLEPWGTRSRLAQVASKVSKVSQISSTHQANWNQDQNLSWGLRLLSCVCEDSLKQSPCCADVVHICLMIRARWARLWDTGTPSAVTSSRPEGSTMTLDWEVLTHEEENTHLKWHLERALWPPDLNGYFCLSPAPCGYTFV